MSIIVNARFLTQKVTGTQRFAINIARALKKLSPEIIFLAPPAILHQEIADEFEVKVIGNINYNIYRKLHLPANLLWEQIDLRNWLKKNGRPPLLNLVNTAPFFYGNNFVTIHDLAFRLYPQFFSRRFAFLYNLIIPRLAQKAQLIFTVSQFSKKTIVREFRIPPEQIAVAYNAVDRKKWAAEKIRARPYPWPYILAAGALEPRKNINRLIAAFSRLNQKHLHLVIVGEKNYQVFKSDSSLALTNEKACRIVFTGYLQDQQLRDLYYHAECFCYPSLYEGFGLPPLEAQALGCPVIVSNITSLPEVFRDSAIYCDPKSVKDIQQKLEMLLNNQELRQKLTRLGSENVDRFDWNQSAKTVIANVGTDLAAQRALSARTRGHSQGRK